MRKIIALFALFSCFGIANQASANKADQAACESPPSNGVWHGLARDGEKCVCQAGYFNNRRIPKEWKRHMEQLAGKSLINAVITDICTSIDVVKAVTKKQNIVIPVAPKAPAPIRFSAALEPESSPKARAGSVVEKTLSASTGEPIIQIRTNCDNCLANGKQYSSDDSVRASREPFSRVFALTPADPIAGGTAKFTVVVVTKDAVNHVYDSTAEWEPKALPAPVVSPEKLACEASPSNGKWSDLTHRCSCIGDFVEQNGVCVPKPLPPPPAPVVKTDEGTYFHPYVGAVYSYGSSATLKGSNGYFNLGLGVDLQPWLLWKIGVGIGGPGATRIYTDGTPVLLANGNVDKRSSSFVADTSLMLHFDWWGFDLGIVRQARGTTNWFNPISPADVTTSVELGVKAIWQLDGFAFVIGPDFVVGAHTMGSRAANTEVGIVLRLDLLFFNPRRLAGTRIR